MLHSPSWLSGVRVAPRQTERYLPTQSPRPPSSIVGCVRLLRIQQYERLSYDNHFSPSFLSSKIVITTQTCCVVTCKRPISCTPRQLSIQDVPWFDIKPRRAEPHSPSGLTRRLMKGALIPPGRSSSTTTPPIPVSICLTKTGHNRRRPMVSCDYVFLRSPLSTRSSGFG